MGGTGMSDSAAKVDLLIRTNRLREAGTVVLGLIPPGRGGLRDELNAWLARLTQADTQRRTDDLSADEYAKTRAKLARQLLDLRRTLDDQTVDARATAAQPAAQSVFLSYNHADTADASAIRDTLGGAGIAVRMDVEAMPPGMAIRDFIRESIRATNATVCIVSERSLLSGWVAQETALALAALNQWINRRFIACYLDTAFLDTEFRLRATEFIDARLVEIEKLFPQYAQRRIDTVDLNAEKSRLFELRHQLGAILERLRGSLCLDIRLPARAASLAKLVQSLRGGDAA
jgi:hypothetical protein